MPEILRDALLSLAVVTVGALAIWVPRIIRALGRRIEEHLSRQDQKLAAQSERTKAIARQVAAPQVITGEHRIITLEEAERLERERRGGS